MLRLTRHAQAEPHTSTPRRHDLGVLRPDEFFFDIARHRNETRVPPRTPDNIVTEREALLTRARAAAQWAPAGAERTVMTAGPAFGGWNGSYTVVELRLFGEQRPLASQPAGR